MIKRFGGYGQIQVIDEKAVPVMNQERRLGINWAAYGTVSIEEAEMFMQNLKAAIEYAKSIEN